MSIVEILKREISNKKCIGLNEVDVDKPFLEYGLDSMEIIAISGRLEKKLNMVLSPTLLLDYPCISKLCDYLEGKKNLLDDGKDMPREVSNDKISVIGMSCKFANVDNLSQFQNILKNKVDCLSPIPARRYELIHQEKKSDEKYLEGGYIKGIEEFDHSFFDLTYSEAESMDPQQRILLQEVYHALEDANITKDEVFGKKVGVFVGVSNTDYMRNVVNDTTEITTIVGNSLSILANRISYVFDFKGPSISLDTACSSSLVAITQGVRSLRNGECDIAIVGGVNVILDPKVNEGLYKANMLSKDGRCFSFDERANGYARGEGVGVVVLQKESTALVDERRIYANILSCSVNQDGKSASLTAPNKNMQIDVIRDAWGQADKKKIEYVEAHGTGTQLGDAIEIAALDEAYECQTRKVDDKLKIGTVKTNIGHLESAAGIAGFIKLALSIYNNELYPLVNFQKENEKLGLEYRNIELVKELKQWKDEERVGAISSFGFGGTNSHVIMEKCEKRKPSIDTDTEHEQYNFYFIPVSAKSNQALQNKVQDLYEYVSNNDIALKALQDKLIFHKDHNSYRKCYVVSDIEDLKEKLKEDLGSEFTSKKIVENKIAVLFSGQGTQWKEMAKGLFIFPTFYASFQKCRDLFLDLDHCDIQEVYESGEYQRTYTIQPLLFSIQVSLLELLKDLGVNYKMAYGHSMGDVTAAYASGMISLKQAVEIIHYRSEIMDRFTGKGKMLSISISEEQAEQWIAGIDGLSISVVNEQNSVVVSGGKEELQQLEEKLSEAKIRYLYLPVDYAFHYVGLEPYMEELENNLGKVKTIPSKISYVSTVTGKKEKANVLQAAYWAKNMRCKVQFLKASEEVLQSANMVVEIGASRALGNYLLNISNKKENAFISVQKRYANNVLALFEALAEMYIMGVDIRWKNLIQDTNPILGLPEYPFDKKICWYGMDEKKEDVTAESVISVEKIYEFIQNYIAKHSNFSIEEEVIKLSDISMDSLKLFQFRAKIQEKYDVLVDLSSLIGDKTLFDLASIIYEEASKNKDHKNESKHELLDYKDCVTDNQKLIILDQWIDSDSSKYNMYYAWKFQKPVDVEQWSKAYEIVMNRHIALISVYTSEAGQICQKRKKQKNILEKISFTTSENVVEYIEDYVNKSFDLAESVCRGGVIQDANRNMYFALSIHHVAIDGISIYLLVKEIIERYIKLCDETSEETSFEEKYYRYQSETCSRKQKEEYKQRVEEWKKYLGESHFANAFPGDRIAVKEEKTETYAFKLSDKTLQMLTDASKKLKVTKFAILYAAYQLMIYKLTGDKDFITCTYFSGRKNHTELETIGYMVQPLYLRTKIDHKVLGKDFVKNGYLQQMNMYEKSVDLSDLNGLIEQDSKLNHVFVYEKAPADVNVNLYITPNDVPLTLAGLDITALNLEKKDSQYDMVIMLEETQNDIWCKLEYKNNVYTNENAKTMKCIYEQLLSELLNSMDASILQYRLVSKEDELRISKMLRGEYTTFQGKRFYDYLMENAEKMPEKIAAVYGQEKISYQELADRSRQLSQHILNRTQGKKEAIGVCMEKSIDFLIAIFAIMQSGCFYIPMDYAYPKNRLMYIIENASIHNLICDQKGEEQIKDVEGIDVMKIADLKDSKITTDIVPEVSLDDIAYAIYTSGSTGNPKGVLVTHRGIENVVEEQKKLFRVTPDDRVCFFASISFDASVFEILMGIGHGATLYFDQKEKVGAGKILNHYLRDHEISIVTLPASALESMENKDLQNLRVIVTAGEPCSKSIKDKWAYNHEFYNAYGVTEATIWNTTERCAMDEEMNIGYSVSNTQLAIVNSDMNVCPEGVPGELLIAGISLSDGYIGLPELNKNKFVINEENERFYRSGDLVRLNKAGKIEYLGRIDNQVKLRGFRIELEEIERLLENHEKISSAIVVIDKSNKFEKLLAFVKPIDNNCEVTEEELKKYIEELVPAYMIPNEIISVSDWKLTVNGKIDKKYILSEYQKKNQESNKEDNTNITQMGNENVPINLQLCQYIGSMIGTTVREDDNLMHLGVNSIMIFELMSYIHENYGVSLKFDKVMKSNSIREIIEQIKKSEKYDSLDRELQSDEAWEVISDKQIGIWLQCKLNQECTEYNIPVVLKLEGELNIPVLCKAIKQLEKNNLILRTNYVYDDDKIVGKVLDEIEDEIEVVDIQEFDEYEKNRLVNSYIVEMQNLKIDVTKTPLFKFLLLQRSEKEFYIMFTIHHLIADGWSVNIIIETLGQYYEKLLCNESLSDSRGFQYRDYVYMHRNDTYEEYQNYWINKLENVEKLELVAATSHNQNGNGLGENKVTRIDKALFQKLESFTKECKIPVSSVLIGAYALLLKKYSNGKEIIIGIPNIGRETKEELYAIGMFLDVLLLKIDVNDQQIIRSYLKKVMNELLETNSKKVPYNQLVNWIPSKKQRDNQSLFQAMFNMINFELKEETFANIPVQVIENKDLLAKYDMTLYATEKKDCIELRLNYKADQYHADVMETFLNDYVSCVRYFVDNPYAKLTKYSTNNNLISDISKDLDYVDDFDDFMKVVQKKTIDTSETMPLDFTNLSEVLMQANYKKGDCVGIVTDRKERLVSTVLYMLKNGIAFIIIDSTHASQRRVDIIESAEVSILLELDKDYMNVQRVRDNVSATRDYRLITSGTTGKPKCIVGRNEALSHFVKWEIETFQLDQNDRFSLLSGLSHDPLMRDILVPAYLGAQIILPEKSAIAENDLYKYFINHKISVSHLTPTMARMLILQSSGKKKLLQVKALFLGGEQLDRDLVEDLKELCPNGKIVNYYGASETPQAMLYEVNSYEEQIGSRIAIGKGIADVEGFILDENNRVCGPFCYGEITIKTHYLSKGYINDDTQTKEKFMNNPYRHNEILYKTGDYGYMDLNHKIYFLNRNDSDVKVLGHRVNLVEIQQIINQHELVMSNVVLMHQNKVCCFVVGNESDICSRMKQWMREKYDDYMIPEEIIQVDTIPLTHNGKTDFKHLLHLLEKNREEDKKVVSELVSISKLEADLLNIWSKILEKNNISVYDKFFEEGGNSFKAVQLQNELEKYLGQEVDIVDLFKYPTIRSFVNHINEKSILVESTQVAKEDHSKKVVSGEEGYKPENNDKVKVFTKDNVTINGTDGRASKMKKALQDRRRR